MRKKFLKSMMAVIAATSILGSTVAYASEIQDLKNEKNKIDKEKDTVEDQLAYLMVEMDELEVEMANINEELSSATVKLADEEEKLSEQYADMKLRIKYMYEDQDASIADVFLTSGDMSEVINKSEYVQQVYSYDRTKLTELAQTAAEIKNIKDTLEEKNAALTTKADELTTKKSLLYTTLENLRKESKEYESKIVSAQLKAAQQSAKQQQVNSIVANNDSDVANGVVQLAYSFLGVPYVYGGSSPSGFDCSGLTSYCFKQFGIYIARGSNAQSCGGQKVNSVSEALPGDLVFYPGHVGIYIGNNQIIHAPHTGDVVRIAKVNIMTITGIRRYW